MSEKQSHADQLLADRHQLVTRLLQWWDEDHRHLPWRGSKDPYAVWVAEVMLQQTQIATVIPYYERWLSALPDVATLAAASLDDVLKLWQGLGYYSRARNLHAAAKIVAEQFNGRLPEDVRQLRKLPGVGRYTAGAIASIAFDQQTPVLDGNVIRVLSRLSDLDEDVTRTATRNSLWRLAGDLVPSNRPGDYNQAIMELGQRLCLSKAPDCTSCPLEDLCLARKKGSQYERPVRPPRKRTPHYDVVAGVIWRSQISADEKFLIARRPLDGMLGGLWEFPGGKVETDESYQAALRREIAEELALEIRVGQYLGAIKHAYTHFQITLHVFFAYLTNGVPQDIGVADHAWVSLSDLEDFAFAATDLRIIENLKRRLASNENLANSL